MEGLSAEQVQVKEAEHRQEEKRLAHVVSVCAVLGRWLALDSGVMSHFEC